MRTIFVRRRSKVVTRDTSSLLTAINCWQRRGFFMKKMVIVKLGRSIATTKRNKLDLFRFEQLAKQIKRLQAHNVGFIFVVSAAVCCGGQIVDIHEKADISKELLGGVGQAHITSQLYTLLGKQKLRMAQRV